MKNSDHPKNQTQKMTMKKTESKRHELRSGHLKKPARKPINHPQQAMSAASTKNQSNDIKNIVLPKISAVSPLTNNTITFFRLVILAINSA